MNVSNNLNNVPTLFNCKICKASIQNKKLIFLNNEIVCMRCHTDIGESREFFPEKDDIYMNFKKKREISFKTDLANPAVINRRSQKSASDPAVNNSIYKKKKSMFKSSEIDLNLVIDFSCDYPADTIKHIFSEGRIDEYVNTNQYKFHSKNLSKCIICLNNFNTEDMLIKMECHHTFHSECISSWLNVNSSCPTCRIDLEL